MGYIVPNTEIRLLNNVKLTNSYEHTGYFPDIQTQTNKFLSKTKHVLSDYSYTQYSNNKINVELPVGTCLDCSYMMFKNTSYENKWFYAFITDVEYVNNETTRLTFELDEIQTWYFEHRLNACMVEREHTASDRIGEHILDENLPCGEYVEGTEFALYDTVGNDKWAIVVATNETASGASASARMYGGLLQGCRFSYHDFNQSGIEEVSNMIERVVEDGQEEAIISIFLIPKEFYTAMDSEVGVSKVVTIPKDYTPIDGYTPKNNKLFCYPYNMLYMTNQQGTTAIFKYEFFTNTLDSTSVTFQVSGVTSPDMVFYIIPTRYGDNEATSFDEALTFNGAIQCSFNTDYYKAWLAQNNARLGAKGIDVLATGLGVAGGIALTGINPVAGAGVVAGSLLHAVNNIYADMKTAEIQPPQLKGQNSNGTLKSVGRMAPLYCRKTITYAYAKMIDDYFTMFGYKVNTLKVPQLNNRTHYTFCKTVGCNITGNLPQSSIKKINAIFDNGITHWVNIDEIGDYSVNNAPA